MSNPKIKTITLNNVTYDVGDCAKVEGTTLEFDPGVYEAPTMENIINAIYPVGSIYISISSSNPGAYLSGTTWVAFGQGKTLIGVDPNDTSFNYSTLTGGEKTHTLTTSEMPSHNHNFCNSDQGATPFYRVSGSASGSNALLSDYAYTSNVRQISNTGGGQAHNNLPPYITVYMWQRIS